MNRRSVLKSIALAGASAFFTSFGRMEAMGQALQAGQSGGAADLAAVMGGEPAAMLRRALAELGGIERYVRRGQKVAVKPNIGWDKKPELGANTNPDLVVEIIKQCQAAGASEIYVFDHTCDEWTRCYQNSGIEAAAKAAGAVVVPANQETYYKPVDLPGGKLIQDAKVHQAIIDADVWINVPVLKHHGGANLSIAMKNYMGLVWDRRVFHKTGLAQCIADACTMEKKPVLNIVDAYRVVQTNGPQGRSQGDVVATRALFAARDIVAVDTVASRFFGQVREMPLDHVPYLAYGQSMGLGSMDLDALNIKRIKM